MPATPESSLKRSLDEDVKKSGLRIRIVEKSGMSVKRVLQRSDPFKNSPWQAFEMEGKGGFGREGNARGARGGRGQGNACQETIYFRHPAY